jgi:hypothetical protein
VDPLTKDFAWYTPYQFAGNTPIQAIDLDGMEEFHYTMTMDKEGEAVLKLVGKPKYYNEHSLFGFKFKTEILSKRYEVDYEGKKYYIGYAQFGTGYSNSGKADKFEADYIKSKGSAIAFEYNYYDANHSQAGSDAAYVTNAQNKSGEVAIPFALKVKATQGASITKTNNTLVKDKWADFDFEEYQTVYHKGTLDQGKVSSDRTFSTGTDRATVDKIRGGTLYEFKILKSVFNEWKSKGLASPMMDYDHKTGVVNHEIRFSSKVADQLNNYKR